MAFNIDLHTHSFFSGDSVSSPEDMIAAARGKGLHGIAITDHNTCDAVNYLLQKGLMRLDGLPVDDFLVLPGVEVTTADGHLALYRCRVALPEGKTGSRGLRHDPPARRARPFLRIRTICFALDPVRHVSKRCRSTRSRCSTPATTLRRYNRYAFKYAQIRGLPMTAASDAHHAAAVGHRLHDHQYGRLFRERNSRADRKEQRTEPAIPDPARQLAQNVEQLVAAAATKENS